MAADGETLGAPAARGFDWLLASLDDLPVGAETDRLLIAAFDRCIIRPERLVIPMARYLAAKWPRALGGAPAPGEPQLFDVVRDPVLLAMLRATPAATPGLDMLLARVRHGVLRTYMGGGGVASFAPMLASLAVRGWHSGYATTLPLEPRHDADRAIESELVAQLSRQLAAGERSGDDAVLGALVYAACALPTPDHLRAALATGNPLVAFVERQVIAPSRRQAVIAHDLTALTPVDATSAPVADQYEAHPYPAWVDEPGGDVALPPAIAAALGTAGVRSVLVAGCGTGQHAITTACAWPAAEVLAIDISRTSLAYAIDRTGERFGTRLRFELADLLHVAALGRGFDVIETMGVLHHLADPDAGLRALTAVLAPGGLIGIGLYAAAARTGLDAIRERYGAADMRSDDAVRHFRAWALANLRRDESLYSPDFYSIGGCRDAFFHVRERCYTLDEVGAMLARAGLRLLAIATPPEAEAKLTTLPAADNLAGWTEAERQHPDLFLGMYEIWAQKPVALTN